MKSIFSANEEGKYEVGSMDILKVYIEFHSSSMVSSSAPIASGSMVRIEPTKFKFEILITEEMAPLLSTFYP
jgi:hypothetical protein